MLYKNLGAGTIVTGSAHLIVTKKSKILIDFGMFQGEYEYLNYKPLTFTPKEIDALILTHGHLDHVGRIPLLYKEGFKGEVFAHPATFDIAKVVLLDSAMLQKKSIPPLYTKEEVKKILKKMKKNKIKYKEEVKFRDILIKLKNAGHILGSAFVEITHDKQKVVFSGDLGNKDNEIMPKPQKTSIADVLFIESTYADRNHKSFKKSKEEFKEAILKTINKGNVIIPSFAIERAQQILCILKEMSQQKLFPKNTKVFLDSPMAKKVTLIYKKYKHLLHPYCKKFKNHPFEFKELFLIKDKKASKKINRIKKGAIIIAGSGMCTGGRILHHLKHTISNPKNSIVFVGYQAKGTLGREIIDGAKTVTIFEKKLPVKAKIYTINGFSAHADQKELIEWMSEFKKLNKIFLIHGEYEKQLIFKKVIKEKLRKDAHIVRIGEEIVI